ncbi:caspase family protein [Streptomyces sp. A7024]|uniref:Caspase family protein n=1 Tax=Streptomyces coryli TaxID=1128680 RepID=A0A6G4TWQ5_9ACTN|nr:caspase family protein [Streptomyces coryli]NGN63477.1 caspase family protein [Streptomyces coryli]
MGTVYALLVGINAYPPGRFESLKGCRNDIAAVRTLLTGRLGGRLAVRELLDADATPESVEDGIRGHLGRAGADDTALFWYAGHGSDFEVTDPAYLRIEATGRMQALVCADGRPLVDKRLGALLNQVAAGGAHTAAVLDSCFSGGATRGGPHLTARFTPPDPGWQRFAGRAALLPDGPGRHVLLAGSRLDQPSCEGSFDGRYHGLFTRALVDRLTAYGPSVTYRELHAALNAQVQKWNARQHPVLSPVDPGGLADQPFLGGLGTRTPSPHLLRDGRDGWEVDCGSGHGLVAEEAGTEFTVTGPAARGQVVRAKAVEPERTLVAPADWRPEPGEVYPVALSALELPPASVTLAAPGQPAIERALAGALGEAGPGGGPSPLLRLVEGAEHAGDLWFRVEVHQGAAHVLRRDGSAFVAPLPLADPDAVHRVAACLVHLARWHQLRDLDAPAFSPLRGRVRVEVAAGKDGPPLVPDGSGEIVRRYEYGPRGPVAPRVSIRLRHEGAAPGRRLWCVLLDLTDEYGCHTGLFTGDFVGAGHVGHALDGAEVQLSLPERRPPVPGAATVDWLKVIVAEGELNTVPFHLDPWDPAAALSRAAAGERPDGVLRLEPPAHGSRVAGPVPAGGPGQWATHTVQVRTVVPG